MNIPLEYLFDCSRTTLGEHELSRLNRVANLKKEMRELVDEIIECEAQAEFARWMLEHREELRGMGIASNAAEETLDFRGCPQGEAEAQASATDCSVFGAVAD